MVRIAPWDITTQQLVALLSKFMNPRDARIRVLLDAGLRYKQQVFTLGLDDIAAGNGIQAARPAGWWLLAECGPGRAVAVDMTGGIAPEIASISDLREAKEINDAIAAIHQIQGLPQAQDAAEYDLQILQVSGLHLEAYWLKAQPGGTDYLFPFHTPIENPAPLTAYPADQFLQHTTLTRLATERLAFNDTSAYPRPVAEPSPAPAADAGPPAPPKKNIPGKAAKAYKRKGK